MVVDNAQHRPLTTSFAVERELTVLQVRQWASAGRLFAVIDACDTPSVPERAQLLNDRARDAIGGMMRDDEGLSPAISLYKGRSEEELWAIAPYLFDVSVETYDWITTDLWAAPWGYFLLSDVGIDEMRAHLRRFLTVRTSAGDEWYFRFYDPRVMRNYVDSCTREELQSFFGPIRAIASTHPKTYGVTVISRAEHTPSAPTIAIV